MISLVQVLIAAVLIPVSFGAPAVNASESTSIPVLVSTTSPKTFLLSRDGMCGEGTDFGCDVGVCCSKEGRCGTTKDHCGADCQSAFGSCDPTGPIESMKMTRNGKCGRGTPFYCNSGKCCSQRGFCGFTKEHCGVGCQSAFGLCDPTGPVGPLEVKNNYLCGRKYGYKCDPGFCCSQYGFCGKKTDSCGIDCQEAFGNCDSRLHVEPPKVSKDGKCGKGTEFVCDSGNCCSEYGTCGATSDYCGFTCQWGFGLCDPNLPYVDPFDQK
ncbi:hypothetical protein BASA50_004901 [Batrachochytrium salamandrivorans]|uniref:Chitin-binding type-1 domain-containing protein n=1 Tax=Batrachochytrium salamandrivorans TaxID=1357716 RepID=A0ABQ8FH48_9FUNG|nr:hypothetical protein BASA62_006617 [Batrachochytrium salamandrivorans]KAH6577870.1 hypothetical protein BASA60_003844 [Batrachochytrium salamandrivorans]KAH6580219.1 hypothetical protein BASA61_009775 [Batrachochytrium salamandrivorans]KAH6596796.1 hypothetical protein BASA50_004901 [Batrachochytrium salamandrivorans]